VPKRPYEQDLRCGPPVELGYARVSTAKRDLDRQVDALRRAGIAPEWIYLDKKSGATTDRPGLKAALAYARNGDVIVVHTLDRLGRTVRDTLNLIHELAERGVGVRNLGDPIKVDSTNPTNPADPMAQLAVVLLALFGQIERTYTLERAAHARAVATAKGRRIGRPSLPDPDKLAYAAHLRDTGHTIPEIIAKTGIARTTPYRHLPPRLPEQLTVAAPPRPADHQAPADHQPLGDQPRSRTVPGKAVHLAAAELLEAVDWPDGYRPPCPACTLPTIGLREQWARRAGVREPVVVVRARPCGCAVDEHAAQLQQAAPHPPGSTAPAPTTRTTPATS
jgi:DNA invertase Pin-like site-specific DNA recombinase